MSYHTRTACSWAHGHPNTGAFWGIKNAKCALFLYKPDEGECNIEHYSSTTAVYAGKQSSRSRPKKALLEEMVDEEGAPEAQRWAVGVANRAAFCDLHFERAAGGLLLYRIPRCCLA